MSNPALQGTSEPPARRFGREIKHAVASGADADTLVLHLTLMDASKVKRDSEISRESVSFSPDGMRFLGVRVVQGGVRTSTLRTDGASPVDPPGPTSTPKPRAKRAAAEAKAQ